MVKLEMLTYPEDFPKAYTGTLLGGKSMQFFLGNYGEDKVVLIDPDSKDAFRLVEPADPARGFHPRSRQSAQRLYSDGRR